ncbi:MAG: bifunctional 4-hydroxy-3-methylbut-2-enyl diphosphate reductase/30S ribosomal protein S1 [Clostridia bacterium]|nr:bifunctional 4-hydroxy-3-methylbut-2-enyl diphosphate reductase/30S ribosomal protein S1 [Clostridia bacterium]
MEIIKAKSAGFCFGVNNAVCKAFETAEKYNGEKKIYTYGPLIHNASVIEKLEEKGIFVADSIDDVKEDNACVIIRAHGVSKKVFELLNEKGVTVIDATCPFVTKIQKLVEKEYNAGKKIIIVGDKNHPEVIGINGWCEDSAIIVASLEECKNLNFDSGSYCMVSQTTFNAKNYDKIKKYFRNLLDEIEFYDTICNATSYRQCETREIAATVDLMIVVGGRNSSNTLKLFEISSELCKNVLLVEQAAEIDLAYINKFLKVGVTAGASTPDWIIKEVLVSMSEVKNENEVIEAVNVEEGAAAASDESFSALLESEGGITTVRTGDIIKKPVIKIDSSRVYVDLGFKYEGSIAIEEFAAPGEQVDIKVGDLVEAIVVRVSDKDGEATLSKKSVDQRRDLRTVEEAFENKTPITVKVAAALKGGVAAQYGTARIFVPASQLSTRFVKDLETFVGKELEVLVTSFEKGQKGRCRISASARVLLEAGKKERDDAFWGDIYEGKICTGTVKSFVPFGAFVELAPGYEGLVHITEMSWRRIKNPQDVLELGQEIEVTVLSFDREKNRISLGYRKAEENPWYDAENLYQVGDVIEVTVARFVKYGVFVEIAEGVTGLVHISQISRKRIESASACLKIGQKVMAKIVATDIENRKISLSIKEVQPYDPEPTEEEIAAAEAAAKEKKERAERAAEKKERAAKKAKEEEFKDDVVTSDTSIADLLGDVVLNFESSEE